MLNRHSIFGYVTVESEKYSVMLLAYCAVAIKPLKCKDWYKDFSYEEIRHFINFSMFDENKLLQISEIEFDNTIDKLFALKAFL